MATRILLLDDVYNVGNKGEIVSVRPGFARNYLLPKNMAKIADKNAIKQQARLQEERRQKAIEDKKASVELRERLQGQTFEAYVKVDPEGHLYGSVSALDIVHLIHRDLDIMLDKRFVMLKHPIKETGAYEITLRLKEDVEANIHVKVSAENA